MTKLKVSEIRRDGGTQPRAELNNDVLVEYQDLWTTEPDRFPAVIVFYDGTHYWLADGFHRVVSAEKADIYKVPAEIKQGSRRDAVLYSCGVNAEHGLRRTNEDKRRAVMALLNDSEWSQWSDREIARRCAVSDYMVRSLRENRSEQSSQRTYTTRHGTTATMKTENIGRRDTSSADTGASSDQHDEPRHEFYERESVDPDEEPEDNDGDIGAPERPTYIDADNALDWTWSYIERNLDLVERDADRHFVVNTLIKYLRDKAVSLDRQAASEETS